MEPAPLTWLESLKPGSIDSWEDMKNVFTNNYAGSMQRPGNRIDLAQVKQQKDETLRNYLRHFFEKKATIVDILEGDVIEMASGIVSCTKTLVDVVWLLSKNSKPWPRLG